MGSFLITADDRIVRNGRAVSGEVDGEVVALDLATGACFGLNKVGSRIWTLIEAPRSVAEVCAVLLAEYAVDAATCESQVIDLIGQLLAQELVELRRAEPSAASPL